MLFDHLLRELLYCQNNEGGAGGSAGKDDKEAGNTDGDPAGKPGEDPPPKPEDVKVTMTQAEMDRVIQDRLTRDRQARESAEAKKDRERTEQALQEAGKITELAESRLKTINELTDKLRELEGFKERAEAAEAAVMTQLAELKKDVPAYLTPLLQHLTPAEQLEYLTKHKDDLSKRRTSTVPPNPPKNGGDGGPGAGTGRPNDGSDPLLSGYFGTVYGSPKK